MASVSRRHCAGGFPSSKPSTMFSVFMPLTTRAARSMQTHLSHQNKLGPVLRRARREWRIPAVDGAARWREQRQEEAWLQAMIRATTVAGRELLRWIKRCKPGKAKWSFAGRTNPDAAA